MKKNINGITFALVILSVAGCAVKEQPFGKEEQASVQEITIEAVREGDSDPETKTTLNAADGSILWVPEDAISLFYGSGSAGGSRFVSNATEPCSITNFTGTITAITGGADVSPEDTYFWGVYPYRNDTSCDGTYVTMTLPSQQTAVAGTFATGLFPSIGRSQGLVMGFYNVCGGWRFSVTKEGVRKVTLKSNGGEYITGKVKVGLNGSGVPYLSEIIAGSDEVVLECPAGEYFEVGKNYYMVLLPTVLNSGFTMTFETYTEEGVYNRTAKTTITRSKFSGITNLDNYLTTPYARKAGNISIPDANFKAYMVANFDTNGDGEISYEEADAITTISVNTDNIYSVEGIEYCLNLESLACRGSNGTGQLASIDVSNNTALTDLWCDNNQLVTLDVSNNTALTSLVCHANQLTTLDVSSNIALIGLNCGYNQLTSLDVSNNTALTDLYCRVNQLTGLEVSKNSALTRLECDNNQLSSLDVSNNTALAYLVCHTNQLTTLDISSNIALISLDCRYNQLTSLDVSKNSVLKNLYCAFNCLTSLDVSNNTTLTHLDCYYNQLTSLDVSNNIVLTDLRCGYNLLPSLGVSKNTALTRLECGSNQLSSLDVSNNTALTDLLCNLNQLTSLDVSNNTALTELVCNNNQLTSLDVSNNTALTMLDCSTNHLTTLDVSHNPELANLDCSPMESLATLIITQGQVIPNVTVNRNEDYIPAGTQIVVAPSGGGSEGTDDEELNP